MAKISNHNFTMILFYCDLLISRFRSGVTQLLPCLKHNPKGNPNQRAFLNSFCPILPTYGVLASPPFSPRHTKDTLFKRYNRFVHFAKEHVKCQICLCGSVELTGTHPRLLTHIRLHKHRKTPALLDRKELRNTYTFLKRFQKHLTCEKEKDEDHNHRVAEVEDRASRSNDLQLREEVMHAVDKQIDCCEAAGQEGTPPPVIILDVDYNMLQSTYAD